MVGRHVECRQLAADLDRGGRPLDGARRHRGLLTQRIVELGAAPGRAAPQFLEEHRPPHGLMQPGSASVFVGDGIKAAGQAPGVAPHRPALGLDLRREIPGVDGAAQELAEQLPAGPGGDGVGDHGGRHDAAEHRKLEAAVLLAVDAHRDPQPLHGGWRPDVGHRRRRLHPHGVRTADRQRVAPAVVPRDEFGHREMGAARQPHRPGLPLQGFQEPRESGLDRRPERGSLAGREAARQHHRLEQRLRHDARVQCRRRGGVECRKQRARVQSGAEMETRGPAGIPILHQRQRFGWQTIRMIWERVHHAWVGPVATRLHLEPIGEHPWSVNRGGRRPHPVPRPGVRQRQEPGSGPGDPLPQIPVLAGPERDIESAHVLDASTPRQTGMDRTERRLRQETEEIAGAGDGASLDHAAIGPDPSPPRHRDGRRRIAGERLGEALEMRRVDLVIGVEKQEQVVPGVRHPCVPRGAHPTVGSRHQTDAGVTPGPLGGKAPGLVRGSVVDDDRLPVRHGLREHGSECRGERRGGVVSRNDDRDV